MEEWRARAYEASAGGDSLSPQGPFREELGQRTPYLDRLIARHFPEDREAVVLDLGCGSGALLYCLSHAGYVNLHGVDSALERVAAARTLGLEGVKQADLVDEIADWPAESVDVAVTFDVLEHLERPQALWLADQVRRALRPAGRWIIHVPNGESPFSGRILYGDLTHETAFTRRSIEQLCAAAGFASVDVFAEEPVVHGLASLARWLTWKLAKTGMVVAALAETGSSDVIVSQCLLAVGRK